MADTTPGFVQVPADGAGKKIRNLQLLVLQADGTYQTVQMQVVAIADADGNLLDLSGGRQIELLESINQELQAIRSIQGRATGMFWQGLRDGAMNDDKYG